MYNLQDFILELNAIIPELEKELTNRKIGIAGDCTVEQLILFIDEIIMIYSMAISKICRPKRKNIQLLLGMSLTRGVIIRSLVISYVH